MSSSSQASTLSIFRSCNSDSVSLCSSWPTVSPALTLLKCRLWCCVNCISSAAIREQDKIFLYVQNQFYSEENKSKSDCQSCSRKQCRSVFSDTHLITMAIICWLYYVISRWSRDNYYLERCESTACMQSRDKAGRPLWPCMFGSRCQRVSDTQRCSH